MLGVTNAAEALIVAWKWLSMWLSMVYKMGMLFLAFKLLSIA